MFTGCLLRVDLTKKNTAEVTPKEGFYRKFLGGSGVATKIVFDEVKPETEPLSPDNRLVFAVGPYQGTTIPGSGRFEVAARSPLTGIWGEANGGGAFGTNLAKTGYNTLIFQGRSEEPVYIWIHDGGVEFKDAKDLVGLTVDETDKAIEKELGEPKASVACIGPAGEKLVRIACIICDGGNGVAGRTGLGAVMGSKNLKAVAVKGDKEVSCANLGKLKELVGKFSKMVAKELEEMRIHGQASDLLNCEKDGAMPKKNWALGEWSEGAEKIGTPTFTQTLKAKPIACAMCPVACHRLIPTEVLKKYGIGPGGRFGPQYETLAMLGANCLIDDLPAICKANELCNGYGIDTVSAGALLGFAIECYERGWITREDTGGMDLRWGDPDGLIAMIEKIGKREGFGAVLGEGIRYAAKRIGKGAEDVAVHVKGLDIPAHDPRAHFSMALTYATSTRGACHLHGYSKAAEMEEPVLIPEVGINEELDRFAWKGKAELVAKYQDWFTVCNSLIQCIKMVFGGVTLTNQAQMLSAITGWEITPVELIKIGERIYNLQRAFNVRLGVSRKDDTIPKRMFKPVETGGAAGKAPSLEPMLKEYYALRGWSSDGKPTVKKMQKLGLKG
jgi:aldehyde:ferredoxin oxidoreductase